MYGSSLFRDLVLQHAARFGQLTAAGALAATDQLSDLRMVVPFDGEHVEHHPITVRKLLHHGQQFGFAQMVNGLRVHR